VRDCDFDTIAKQRLQSSVANRENTLRCRFWRRSKPRNG
jgi:hypothetical protein